mgnify:FL=1
MTSNFYLDTMQPNWMDNTERGSAHARSEPMTIPRPRHLPGAAAAQPSRDSLLKSLLFTPGSSRLSGVSPVSSVEHDAGVGFAATAGPPLARPVLGSSLTREESFSAMPFVGGEEESRDHWHDKWSNHRRTSMEEQNRTRDAMAVVFGQAQIKRPLAVPPGTYSTGHTAPQNDIGRVGKAAPKSTREDIYGGNFWG